MHRGNQSCSEYDNLMTKFVYKQKEMEMDIISKSNFKITSKSSNIVHFKPMGIYEPIKKVIQSAIEEILSNVLLLML